MSQTTISPSSSNFQSIFYSALKAYEKKTKKDLLAHPLAVQLQTCNSPSDILAILQDKVKELDNSMSRDERLSRWMSPTVNVLYAFSATLGEGVGLVSLVKSHCHSLNHNFAGVLTRESDLRWRWRPPHGEHLPWTSYRSDLYTEVCHRRPRTLMQAKTPSSIFLNVSRTSSNA